MNERGRHAPGQSVSDSLVVAELGQVRDIRIGQCVGLMYRRSWISKRGIDCFDTSVTCSASMPSTPMYRANVDPEITVDFSSTNPRSAKNAFAFWTSRTTTVT